MPTIGSNRERRCAFSAPFLFSSKGINMANEPNIVEIYVDIHSYDILIYIPATGTLDSGKELPDDAVFIKQINIRDVADEAKTLLLEEAQARL